MALQWRILAPLAVVWLVTAACVHWVWAPRTIAQEEMQYRDRVSGSLERLTHELVPLLKEGREAAAVPLLDQTLRGNASWTALELRDRGGRSIHRADPLAGQAISSPDERGFEQPVIDGAVVLGWLTARVDLGPGFEAIRAGQRELTLLLLAGLAAGLAVTGLALNRFVARPLEALTHAAGALGSGGAVQMPGVNSGDEIGRLAASMARLGDALGARKREIEHELEQRRATEERLRESEERYALAVRGADDGLWEWDIGSDHVYYSPRWKSLLGHTEDEIGDSIEEWRGRIHPDDREATLAALATHLDGATARFENDHRLRHKNGRYRWVLARAATLRTSVGKPYRLVGLNTDITARKRAEDVMISLAEGLALARGDEFFLALVRNFARVLGVRYAFITECVNFPTTRARQLAAWKNDARDDVFEFDLAGTPCQETISLGRVCVYKRDVHVIFPREAGFESYLGIPIFDSAGGVIGHLACYHTEPMQEDLPVQSIFSLFAVRAGVEMERRALEQALRVAKLHVSA